VSHVAQTLLSADFDLPVWHGAKCRDQYSYAKGGPPLTDVTTKRPTKTSAPAGATHNRPGRKSWVVPGLNWKRAQRQSNPQSQSSTANQKTLHVDFSLKNMVRGRGRSQYPAQVRNADASVLLVLDIRLIRAALVNTMSPFCPTFLSRETMGHERKALYAYKCVHLIAISLI
jgi:hypothetical protein